jgi:hypothetical protein
MNPSTCCILRDTFSARFRKLTLHFEEHGAPALHGFIRRLGRYRATIWMRTARQSG